MTIKLKNMTPILRRLKRELEDAINPKGMSVNDGKGRFSIDAVAYLIKLVEQNLGEKS